MKICPTCGKTAGDDSRVCDADGTALGPPKAPTTLPAFGAARPGTATRLATGAKVEEFAVLRLHGEGDILATEAAGDVRLLVYGPAESLANESSALMALDGTRVFPSVVRTGETPEVGNFMVLTSSIDGATPLLELDLSLEAGLDLVRRALDAAAELDAAGQTWEPAPTDLYRKEGGEIVAVRARGSRKRLVGEPFDAKHVLEALAGSLLPHPFGLTTPDLIRLLLPRFNFSTVTSRSVEGAREDVARAEALREKRSPQPLAALCDPGLRRHHNEDATAVAEGEADGERFAVLVVCDGVSSSSHAGEASTIAAKVACDELVAFATRGGGDALAAVRDAIHKAHVEVCTAPIDYGDGPPPGTTIVCALVLRRALTVGWMGDSRAYWFAEGESELCTTDHSWLNEIVAQGSVSMKEAMHSPFAHAITKCLGPLEPGEGSPRPIEPDVRTRALGSAGHVVLCTDGLWNYFPTAESVAELVGEAGPGADAQAIARFLVCRALAEGGGDNVSVAVYAVPGPT